MRQSQRGSLEILVEAVLIVILLITFLIAVHARDVFRKDQEAARAVYPGERTSASFSSGGTPQGIVVGESNSPPPRTYTLPGGMTQGSFTEIQYTDKGFNPSIVKLTGEYRTVLFRNTGSKVMWVASDPYPMNFDLPALNQGYGTTKNGVYWFVFPEGAKTYTYHNELNPSHQGTVIVK